MRSPLDYNHTCTRAELLADKNRNKNIRRIHAVVFYTLLVGLPMLMFFIGPVLYWDEVFTLVQFGFRQVEFFFGLGQTSDLYVTLFILLFLLPGHSYYNLCGICRNLTMLLITMLLAQIGYSVVITKIN